MKLFVLLALLFANSIFAGGTERDIKLVHESVLRVDDLLEYYDSEVEPLLARYKTDPNTTFNRFEAKKINHFWTQLIDHRIVLHTLYNAYVGHAVDYKKNLIKYSSNLALQKSAAILSKQLWTNKKARKKLNETNKAQIPRGSFISLENELFRNFNKISKTDEAKLPTMFPVYSLTKDMENFFSFNGVPGTEVEAELESINANSQNTLNSYVGFISNRRNISQVERRFWIYKFKNLFYFISRKISTWIGDTKVHRRDPDYYNGKTLIDIKLAKKFETMVQPGDVMISRTNWFLSNAFLPGFWMHSFIYLGDKQKLTNFYDTYEVNTYFNLRCMEEGLSCDSLVSYLKISKGTQVAFKKYITKDKYGYSQVLVEATSEGVHFSSIRHTFLNDYLGALRPKASKLDRAKSIVDALEMHGLEYDFDFDYDTDDRLVCSELVSKAYEPSVLKGGFSVNYDVDKEKYLDIITGRLALPVIGFVKKAYDENVKGERTSEFSFVAFLKGLRKRNTAIFSSEREFYESRNWKKWSFMRE